MIEKMPDEIWLDKARYNFANAIDNAHPTALDATKYIRADLNDWKDIETAPKTGGTFYVRASYEIPFKWKKYKPASQQFKRGIKGRWQEMNEYGGWENTDKTPDQWKPDLQPPNK